MGKFIGKYVCYGNADGLFCWGRIKAEAEVNTVEGPREVFILEGRMSGPYRAGGEKIRKFKGDTILRKDMIDLEKDIFDKESGGLGTLTDDDLFLLVLKSREIESRDLGHLGVRNMLVAEAGGNLEEFAKNELRNRVNRNSVPEV